MSAYLNESVDVPAIQLEGSYSGRIATAPADLDERVFVIVPAFSDDYRFGPCRWQARDTISLPAVGDWCLVVFDENQEPSVPLWWPYTT